VRGVPKTRWSEEKKLAFIRDWGAGVSTDGMREKYGISKPSAYALALRKQGYALPPRKSNGAP